MTLNELLTSLNIKKWDYLLFGDGSGTGYDTAIGYAAVSVDRQAGTRMLFTGSANHGTIGQAELLSYLNALRYDFYKTHKGKLTSKRRVTILSDSQVSVNVGNGTQVAHTNKDIWVSFDYFKSVGYEIMWKWVGRNENEFHELAHNIGNLVRKASEAEQNVDVYKLLPTEGPYTIDPGTDWGFD